MPPSPTPAAASALAALLLLQGCGTFPASLYVEDPVLEELSRTRFTEHVNETALGFQMSARLGYEAGRVPLCEARFRRLDLPELEAFDPEDADFVGSPSTQGLCEGDIVLAKNKKPQSLATTLAFRDFTFFNHQGLLVWEEGRFFVLESWPKLDLFGSAPDFAGRLRGHVQQVALSEFLARYEIVEFYRLPDAEANARAVVAARALTAERIPYDPYHDPARPGLSCSEFMALALERAGYALELTPRPIADNPSVRRTLTSLGFGNQGYVVPDDFAQQPRETRVGWMSLHATAAEDLTIREAYRLLHERAGENAPYGEHVGLDPWHLLRYRENVVAFLEWAKGCVRAHAASEPAEIRALLERMHPIFFEERGASRISW